MNDLVTLARRRAQGTNEFDPWGLDLDLVRLLEPIGNVRFQLSVEGEDVLPREGPAVLLAPRRLVAPSAEAFAIGLAVLRTTGRVVRTLGIPDVAPIAPLLRRLGAAVDHPAERRSLLRAGELVLSRDPIETDAPTIRVHTRGWELGRRWRVLFD